MTEELERVRPPLRAEIVPYGAYEATGVRTASSDRSRVERAGAG